MRVWLLLIVLVGTGFIDAGAADKVAAQPAILVMGDSLSAGYGIDIKQGWVALLEQRLRSQGYDYRIVNASVSGETSAGARGRLTNLLNLHHPAIMILEIGANDGLRGLPIAQTKENLTAMIEDAKKHNTRVLIAGMQMPPNYGAKYTQEFAAIFSDLARDEHEALIPFFLDGVALDMNLVQADGLHPTAAAQPRLLQNVWTPLLPMLKSPKLKKK